ncbi:MAG: C39 family peptidase [Candidatus Bathyarchaeota archaeon]|nr:C39 family peptidase [Candidatus Bathyarchaeota archaeon]
MSLRINRTEMLENVKKSVTVEAAARLPGTEKWVDAAVQNRPTAIYDINGELLFYDFPVKSALRGGGVEGYVRAAARKDLGAPVMAYQLGPRQWDFSQAATKLRPKFTKENPKLKIRRIRPVCYSYPKMGVMFEAVDPRGARSKHVFDVASLTAVPIKKEMPNIEGAYAWSFLDAMKEKRTKGASEYTKVAKRLDEIPSAERVSLLKTRTLKRAFTPKYVGEILRIVQTKLLQYCNHYNYTESRSHHCFVLHGQQVNDYCAVATAQMILCYYRYYYTQDQIAPALNYSAGSGCPSDQSPGYESLSSNHINATFDSSPTFSEAQSEINALRPFKSGIPGHARACAGYSRNLLTGANKLYIYDPWPWNADYKLAGTISWEDWNSPTKTNFVKTRLVY